MNKTPKISFHVRHEVRPERVVDVLKRIASGDSYNNITQGDRQVARAVQLGLIHADGQSPTDLGSSLLAVIEPRPMLWGDLGHFLHYALWEENNPKLNAFSYLYRAFCDLLYEQVGFDTATSRDDLERICTDLVNVIEANNLFAELIEGRLSLSPDSLRGVLVWLEALQPPVIVDGKFERRDFCPPELMLLAIGFALRDDPDVLDVDILLSRDLREAICRVCLLDPAVFDNTLDWMLPFFPDVIRSTEEDGYYGRYVRLRKRPTMEDIIR